MVEKLGRDTDTVLIAQKILSKLVETQFTESKSYPACPVFCWFFFFFQGINYQQWLGNKIWGLRGPLLWPDCIW